MAASLRVSSRSQQYGSSRVAPNGAVTTCGLRATSGGRGTALSEAWLGVVISSRVARRKGVRMASVCQLVPQELVGQRPQVRLLGVGGTGAVAAFGVLVVAHVLVGRQHLRRYL